MPNLTHPLPRIIEVVLPAGAPLCASLAAIHRRAFADKGLRGWGAEEFASMSARKGALLLIVPDKAYSGEREPNFSFESAAGQNIIAFLLAEHIGDLVELHILAVTPDFQRRGLGIALLNELFVFAKERCVTEIFLECKDNDLRLSEFYKKAGFYKAGIRRGYYRINDYWADAAIYKKDLARSLEKDFTN